MNTMKTLLTAAALTVAAAPAFANDTTGASAGIQTDISTSAVMADASTTVTTETSSTAVKTDAKVEPKAGDRTPVKKHTKHYAK